MEREDIETAFAAQWAAWLAEHTDVVAAMGVTDGPAFALLELVSKTFYIQGSQRGADHMYNFVAEQLDQRFGVKLPEDPDSDEWPDVLLIRGEQ